MSLTPESTNLAEGPTGASILIGSEVEDLEQELRAVQRKQRRHFVWALTGISPAALIPMIGLFRSGSFGPLILLALLVSVSQIFQVGKAARKANRLKRALKNLQEVE